MNARTASVDVLKAKCPTILRQIRRTARYPQITALWGTSSNYDEIAKKQIVAPPIMRMLAAEIGLKYGRRTFHAGYLHTYGYLFSTLLTPYGLKRDRWLEPTLDERFGFERPTLRIHPHRGTLLGNLTWLLGALVFNEASPQRAQLEGFDALVPENIQRLPRRRLHRHRIVERPAKTNIEIVTDLVRSRALPARPRRGQVPRSVLIYSVRNTETHDHSLITAFPIEDDFHRELIDPERMGPRQKDIRLRFNAVLKGFGEEPQAGTRALAQPAVTSK
ncbi:MAG: hypothetical protein AAFN74_15795 [Myxococcota bacterium]